MKFRLDINGLRAIAIIGVVLFHFNNEWLSGGFSGVDVFFVISGFLMTSIIFRGLESNSFSLFKFYVDRANRIIPALAFLCLVLFVFGWFYLAPIDYKPLGKHILSSMEFSSNHTYLNESGYFDKVAYSKWLLHTWSLSVEWQFYILFPVILIVLKKSLRLETLKKLLLITTIISLIISVYLSYSSPISAFYLLPSRVWEMLLGGVAFLYPITIKDTHKKAMEWSGLSLILIGYLVVSNRDIWPGYMAVIPVLGTYLMIMSNRQNSILTNNVVFQYIGKWSYSIYLWHWPVVVFGVYFSIDNWWVLGIPLSILLGYLSYSLIESIKFKSYVSWKSILRVKPVWMFLLVGILGAGAYNFNGFIFHYSKDLQMIGNVPFKEVSRKLICQSADEQPNECQYGDGKVAAIVIGDSHSVRMIKTIDSLFASKGAVLDWTLDACPTLEGVSRFRQKEWTSACGEYIKNAVKTAQTIYKGVPIFIINRTSYYLAGGIETGRMNPQAILVKWRDDIYRPSSSNEMKVKLAKGFIETACNFKKSNPVIMFRDTPEFPSDVPGSMQKKLLLTGEASRVSISREFFTQRNQLSDYIHTEAQKKCGVAIVDLTNAFCDEEYCYGDKEGQVIYSDANHLTPFGASLTIPLMREQLKNMGMSF